MFQTMLTSLTPANFRGRRNTPLIAIAISLLEPSVPVSGLLALIRISNGMKSRQPAMAVLPVLSGSLLRIGKSTGFQTRLPKLRCQKKQKSAPGTP